MVKLVVLLHLLLQSKMFLTIKLDNLWILQAKQIRLVRLKHHHHFHCFINLIYCFLFYVFETAFFYLLFFALLSVRQANWVVNCMLSVKKVLLFHQKVPCDTIDFLLIHPTYFLQYSLNSVKVVQQQLIPRVSLY